MKLQSQAKCIENQSKMVTVQKFVFLSEKETNDFIQQGCIDKSDSEDI